MKKSILMFLSIAITMTMFATNPIKFGVTGGVSLNSATTNGTVNVGYNAGILLDMPVISNWGFISPSIQYSRKAYNLYCSAWTPNLTFSFNNIEIPLLIKLKSNSIINNKNLKVFTAFGPTLNYVISGLYDNNRIPTNELFEPQLYSAGFCINRINYSFGINFGVEIANKLQISIGYNLGLRNITYNERYMAPKSKATTLTLTYLL